MIQFNLEEYLKSPKRKVITRDGRDVRIVCTDMIGTSYPILVICRVDATHDCYYSYTINGKHSLNEDSHLDLFFAPEKHEGWANVYKSAEFYYLGSINPYPSKSEAISHIMKNDDYVRTVKIEWEEE